MALYYALDYGQADAGSVLEVPEGDARILAANAWVRVMLGGAGSGPTAEHPNAQGADVNGYFARFFDTDLGKLIVWDGANWRDPANGSVV